MDFYFVFITERSDGIQDSKAFQKQWEERLRELKQDADLEPAERPIKKTRGKRRKLERSEREHSPAMSLDSNDGNGFLICILLLHPFSKLLIVSFPTLFSLNSCAANTYFPSRYSPKSFVIQVQTMISLCQIIHCYMLLKFGHNISFLFFLVDLKSSVASWSIFLGFFCVFRLLISFLIFIAFTLMIAILG